MLMSTKDYLMRLDLPYGRRVFSDQTEELFNRGYETIARRGHGRSTDLVTEEFYYSDKNPPWLDRQTLAKCKAVMREWRKL